MKKYSVMIAAVLLLLGMAAIESFAQNTYPFSFNYNSTRTLIIVFNQPEGCVRFPIKQMSEYQIWLTNMPLKPVNTPVAWTNRHVVYEADSILGVIDLGVTSHNQKDPDIPIQILWSYYRTQKAYDKMAMVIDEGDTVRYSKWLEGSYSFKANGKLKYKSTGKREHTNKDFFRCLELAMARTSNKTLVNFNVDPITEKEIEPGDLFVQFKKDDPDSTGHTAMILDVCYDTDGKIFLLTAMGGDPAQSFYIPKPKSINRDWMTIDELKAFLSEYGDGNFYRFKKL